MNGEIWTHLMGWIFFSASLFVTDVKCDEDDDDSPTLNNFLLNGPYNCLNQRPGVVCPPTGVVCPPPGVVCPPPGRPLCKKRCGKNHNGTTECLKRTDPTTHYYLFTPKNKNEPEYLHECGGMLPVNTNFNPAYNTEIFVHGLFDGICRTAVWREIKDQLFFRGKYNVILIDWTTDNTPDIYDAVKAVKKIGKRTACLIDNIMKQTGTGKDKFHLIGHSLGSHIMGYTGQFTKGLRRITALDPANIGFIHNPPHERLSPDDAQMVTAIHVNMGQCFPLTIGYPYPTADADIYPNGGTVQPSCFLNILTSFLKLDVASGAISLLPSFCYHLQVLQYYKVSINSCGCQFVAVECEDYETFQAGGCNSCNPHGSNCAVMGMDWEYYYVPPKDNKTRKYYLNTALQCPYCDNSNLDLNGYPKSAEVTNPGKNCFNPQTQL